MQENNCEDDLDSPVPGWPEVAALMANTPCLASFSRFRRLNIKSLLYYQAELTALEKKLHKREWQDFRRGIGNAKTYSKCANRLVKSGNPKSKNCKEQWKLVKETRVVLREYSELGCQYCHNRTANMNEDEALMQYSQLCSLPGPENHNMKTFREWVREDRAGGWCISGDGEENTWGDFTDPEDDCGSLRWQLLKIIKNLLWPNGAEDNEPDLISTRPQGKMDGFTRWVARDFVPFYHNFIRYLKTGTTNTTTDIEKARSKRLGRPKPKALAFNKNTRKDAFETYSGSSMMKFTSSVSTVVACLMPIVSITVLSQVHGTRNLLLCIAGFASLFSIGLIFLTAGTANRIEIFTATAA